MSITMEDKVLVLYKEIGQTPGELIELLRSKYPNRRMCYSGRLDIMACGYIHILLDDNTKLSAQYNKLDKTYRFQVLVGFNTDSTDILGKLYPLRQETLAHSSPEYRTDEYGFPNLPKQIDSTIVNKFLEYSGQTYEQEYHIYSSMFAINWNTGQKDTLWSITNRNLLGDYIIPSKQVKIYNLALINSTRIAWNDLQRNILDRVSKVKTGGYRVEEIMRQWAALSVDGQHITKLTFEAKVSSGTYIRQLVKDVSLEINVPLCVLEIERQPYY